MTMNGGVAARRGKETVSSGPCPVHQGQEASLVEVPHVADHAPVGRHDNGRWLPEDAEVGPDRAMVGNVGKRVDAPLRHGRFTVLI